MNKLIVSMTCLVLLAGTVTPFPDDEGEVLSEPLTDRPFSMPESCKSKNMSFCFDNAEYPEDIIEELLKDLTNFEVAKEDDIGHIEDRLGDSSDESDCRTKSTTDLIYYIIDEFGNDRVVVQMEGKFEQRYSVRWCEQEGYLTTRTRHFSEATVKNNKMSCENKYMDYDFVVLSLKPDLLGKWTMEKVKTKTGIPVCCSFKYKKAD